MNVERQLRIQGAETAIGSRPSITPRAVRAAAIDHQNGRRSEALENAVVAGGDLAETVNLRVIISHGRSRSVLA